MRRREARAATLSKGWLASPPCRRRHWATWCAIIVLGAALVLIVVPGDRIEPARREAAGAWNNRCRQLQQTTLAAVGRECPATAMYQHGWPLPFMARMLVYDLNPASTSRRVVSTPWLRFASPHTHWGGPTHYSVSWSNLDHWPLAADAWSVSTWRLVVDILAVGLLVGGVAGAIERWLRRRGGLTRFHMVDLIAAITVGSLVLAWLTHHARVRRAETQFASSRLAPQFKAFDGAIVMSQRYEGPEWSRKLAGNRHLLPLLHHTHAVSLPTDSSWRARFNYLTELPYLERVTVRGPLPVEAIEILGRCRRLNALKLTLTPPRDDSAAREPGDSRPPLLDARSLELLQPLELTELEIRGEGVLADDIARVARFPTLERLTLVNVMATPREIEAIRTRRPDLRISTQWMGYWTPLPSSQPPPNHEARVAEARVAREALESASGALEPSGGD